MARTSWGAYSLTRRLFLVAGLWALGVTLAVHFVAFPGSVPNFERASGGGTLLDVKPSFSEEATYTRLKSYGDAGRRNYALRNLTVDIVLPLSVLPFLLLLARRSVSSAQLLGGHRILLLALPITYVAFDLAENGSVLALLSRYPDRLTLLSAVLPYLTLVKRGASLLALAVPLTIIAFVTLRGRRGDPTAREGAA